MQHELSINPRSSRLRDRGVISLWILALVVISVLVALKPNRHTVYTLYSEAGRGWFEGKDSYATMWLGYRYSPPVTVAFSTIGWLPDRIGGVVWRLFGAALMIVGFAYAAQMLERSWSQWSVRQRQWAWLLLLPLTAANLHNGQVNLHMIGLLLIAAAAAADRRWNWCAVCLAAVCLLKVYPIAFALLLVLVFPRQLGLRFPIAMLLGIGLPFLTQSTDYVLSEYRTFINAMIGDDRFDGATGPRYRDLSRLLFVAGISMDRATYFVIQALTGIAAAVLVVIAQWRLNWTSTRSLRLAAFLGIFWMLLCGPATESSTYVLIAPIAALLAVGACANEVPSGARYAILFGTGLVHVALFSSMFPFNGKVHALGVHPLGTLFMLIGFLWSELQMPAVKSSVPSSAYVELRKCA